MPGEGEERIERARGSLRADSKLSGDLYESHVAAVAVAVVDVDVVAVAAADEQLEEEGHKERTGVGPDSHHDSHDLHEIHDLHDPCCKSCSWYRFPMNP